MLQACKGINHKEISQVVGITAMENPNQSVMVNGQVIMGKSFVLHCPICGRVVYSFDQPGITIAQVLQACKDNKAKLLDIATYCSHCGQKLNYDADVIEGQFEEHREPQPEPKPVEEQPKTEEVKEEPKQESSEG